MNEKLTIMATGHFFPSEAVKLDYYSTESEKLRAAGFDVSIVESTESDISDKALLLGDTEILLCSGNPQMPESVIASLPKLRMIVRYGIGVNSFDLDALTKHGKIMCYMPGFCWEEMALHVITMILTLSRNIIMYDRETRAGKWLKGVGPIPVRLSQMTVGIFGFGGSAKKLAPMLKGFGARIISYSPHLTRQEARPYHVTPVTRDELIEKSDIITLHAPLCDETYHMFNDETFARMKPGSILINIARGPMVDMDALIRALESGKLRGAGLDVFEQEPPSPDFPLFKMDNVVLTPHSAYFGDGSRKTMKFLSAKFPIDAYRHNILYLPHIANPEVLDQLSGYTILNHRPQADDTPFYL